MILGVELPKVVAKRMTQPSLGELWQVREMVYDLCIVIGLPRLACSSRRLATSLVVVTITSSLTVRRKHIKLFSCLRPLITKDQ